MSESALKQMPPKARAITAEVLDEFNTWTLNAPMFTSSPEGRVFAEEMRSVIYLARLGYIAVQNGHA